MNERPRMNSRPNVFIGSSSEGLLVARALNANLDDFAEATLWPYVFEPLHSYLESLTKALGNTDFAVLLLTPDDATKSRGTESSSPRDNVIFELGLFMGHLGRDRCIFIHEKSSPIKLPSDLLGITGETFETREDGNLRAALERATCTVQSMVNKLGPRAQILRFMHQELQTNSSLPVPNLSGEWAGYSPDGPTPNQQNSTATLRQLGSFVQGSLIYKTSDGEREFELEGRFTAGGQLVLFFQDTKARWFIVGTFVLHLASDLKSLIGQSIYYDHKEDRVIPKTRLFRRNAA